jgi:hypothetical protein
MHMYTKAKIALLLMRLNYRRGSTEQMSWNVTFLMQIMFEWYNYMVHEVWGQKDHPSGLDRNTVQILALSFHITGHHAPTRASFHPKTIQEDFLYDLWYQIILPGVWKVYLVKVDFPPFWHPFCWFSLREMGQNGVSGQVLLRFAPFLLQW